MSVKTQVVVAVVLLAMMVFLLMMSNRTGQSEFERIKEELDNVEVLNVRMDGSIFLLMFELQMDFDQLTDLQRELRDAAQRLTTLLPGGGDRIVGSVERKLALVEDFKSQQAVFRNSRAIAVQMIAQLWAERAARLGTSEHDLFEVERALLDFIGRRDPVSAARLSTVLRETSARRAPITALAEWSALSAHAVTMMDYAQRLTRLLQSAIFYDVPITLFDEGGRLAERLSASSAAAARYRSMLFVVGVLLLGFSGLMAARVRRYLQLVEHSNNELEDRVHERTEELANVNAALRAEIAEREHVESQLRIAQKLEAIGQLASGIAHEINTPTQYLSDNLSFLTVVWQDLQPLLEDYGRTVSEGDASSARREIWERANVSFLREEVPVALQQSTSGLQQIASIVLAMKNFSHPGGNGLHPADINFAIQSTVTVAGTQWKRVAELHLDLDRRLPPVRCNVSAFNQVMLNLLVNAAHAIAESKQDAALGRISVSSRVLGGCVEVSVEDDGAGVPLEIRDRIFDPFFTTKEVGKGTGQGLAISHRVIHQLHGGTLTLEDTESGRGARFVIRLPLSDEDTLFHAPVVPLRAANA